MNKIKKVHSIIMACAIFGGGNGIATATIGGCKEQCLASAGGRGQAYIPGSAANKTYEACKKGCLESNARTAEKRSRIMGAIDDTVSQVGIMAGDMVTGGTLSKGIEVVNDSVHQGYSLSHNG